MCKCQVCARGVLKHQTKARIIYTLTERLWQDNVANRCPKSCKTMHNETLEVGPFIARL